MGVYFRDQREASLGSLLSCCLVTMKALRINWSEMCHDTGGEFTTVYHGRLLGLAALFHEPSEFWIGSRKDHYTTNSCVTSGAAAGGPSVALAASPTPSA